MLVELFQAIEWTVFEALKLQTHPAESLPCRAFDLLKLNGVFFELLSCLQWAVSCWYAQAR